jgi:hypothetical protein
MFNLLVFRIPDLAESVSLKKYEKVMGSCKALWWPLFWNKCVRHFSGAIPPVTAMLMNATT